MRDSLFSPQAGSLRLHKQSLPTQAANLEYFSDAKAWLLSSGEVSCKSAPAKENLSVPVNF